MDKNKQVVEVSKIMKMYEEMKAQHERWEQHGNDYEQAVAQGMESGIDHVERLFDEIGVDYE